MKVIFLLTVIACSSARKFSNPILEGGNYPDPGTIKVDGIYYIVTTGRGAFSSDNQSFFPISTSKDLVNWTQAGKFNNPALGNGDYPDPGAIKVDGVYYIVTTTNFVPNKDEQHNKYPISTSTDLVNWTRSGYVFTSENFPNWTDIDHFWAPEIHRVGDSFRLYYTARALAQDRLTIGVATAPAPGGPYTDSGAPLIIDPEQHGNIDPTLINDNGTLYLIYKDLQGGWLKGRPLKPDGLSFASENITKLFTTEYPWEAGVVEGPWYRRRGQYHYLYYSGNGYCGDKYRVGVARALSPLGPYEKRGDPILENNSEFVGPGHNSMTVDLNDEDDVMVFHAFKNGEVCGPYFRLTCLASVGWGDDDWPYVYDWN